MEAATHRAILKYYDRYRVAAPYAFVWRSMCAKSKVESAGWLNRQRDYLALRDEPLRLGLHRRLQEILTQAACEWPSHDYGEGYFYQSCRAVGITGLRDTEARINAMGLRSLVADKTVLEIGCNSGFLSLALARDAASITAFDINPHLIRIARTVAEQLAVANVGFEAARFEDWNRARPHDVVISFANHSTYDGNTSYDLAGYIARCAALAAPGGLLLFESHAAGHERADLDGLVREIEVRFEVTHRSVLEYGTPFDSPRTFVIARRR
jgi:2-polyprenyl-3-methyl-5-hydroxy-6-metoxy-1,4-benzoquinol methylase